MLMSVEFDSDEKTKVTLTSKPGLRSIPSLFLCSILDGQFDEVAKCLAEFIGDRHVLRQRI